MNTLKLLSLASLVMFLSACGGGGGGGGSDDDDNDDLTEEQQFAEETAIAGTESTKQAIATEEAPPIPFGPSVEFMTPFNIARELARASAEFPLSLSEYPLGPVEVSEETINGECGGSYTVVITSTTPDAAGVTFPFSLEMDGDLDNYCTGQTGESLTMDGFLDAEFNYNAFDNYSFTVTYDLDYVYDFPGLDATGSISATETCTVVGGVESCSVSTSYQSTNGILYTASNVVVSGNSSTGYSVTGSLEDEDGNTFTLDVNGFTLCSNGNVQNGTVEITVNGEEIITVTFPNCNECIITYQGVSRTVPQPDE